MFYLNSHLFQLVKKGEVDESDLPTSSRYLLNLFKYKYRDKPKNSTHGQKFLRFVANILQSFQKTKLNGDIFFISSVIYFLYRILSYTILS